MVIQQMMQNRQMQDEKTPSEAESNPENVLAKGYGLSTGLAGQPNIFTLDARQAGFGDFDVVIKGASRATIEYLEEEEALYKIKYHVALPGDYLIEIKYDQLHIPGSPFSAQVMDPSLREDRPFRKESGSQTNTSLESFSSSNDVSEDDNNNLFRFVEALVITPSGKRLTGQLVTKYNGELSVKFPREEIGTYEISILNKKTSQPVGGSPYKVVVEKQRHKSSLTASGKGLRQASLKETNSFTISGANEITLSKICIAAIGMGSSVVLSVLQNHAETVEVVYDVKQSGAYLFYIREHGEDILSSPFEVKQFDKNEKDKLFIVSAAVWFGCEVYKASTETTLTTPTGKSISHTIARRGRHLLEIRFLPTMNGEYVLNISFNDNTSEDQSFKIPVQNYISNEEIFQVSGEGLQNACTSVPATVFIESKLPVSRSFTAEFSGPDKVDIAQSFSKEGKLCVTYVVKRPGCYVMSLKYDGFHIGASPYHIAVTDNGRKIVNRDSVASCFLSCHAYGDGLSRAIVGKPNHFTVDALNAGSGALMAGFEGNSLTEVVCKHVGNCMYEIHYKVMEVGIYKMDIFWAGQHIVGSPFSIQVQDENNNL